MKKSILFLFLIITTNLFGTEFLKYKETTQNKVRYIDISIVSSSTDYIYDTGLNIYRLDLNYNTIQWQYKNPDDAIDITAVKKENEIIITGTKKNKPVNIVNKIGNNLWHQAIMELGPLGVIKLNQEAFKYKVMRPDIFSLQDFTGKRLKNEIIEINGKKENAMHTVISFSGILALFWNADYWYRISDGVLLRYKTTYGPFAPETIVELIEEKTTE